MEVPVNQRLKRLRNFEPDFSVVEYTEQQFRTDLHGLASSLEAFGDRENPSPAGSNTAEEEQRRVARHFRWFLVRYEDFEVALGRMLVFQLILTTLRGRADQLLALDLLAEEGGGELALCDGLVGRLLAATRHREGGRCWLDSDEVEDALRACATDEAVARTAPHFSDSWQSGE